MAQVLRFHNHRKHRKGHRVPLEDISQERIEEIFRLSASIFTITFGRRPSVFCHMDGRVHELLAMLNLVESNELFEIGRAWLLDVLHAERHLPRLRDVVLLSKKQSIKDTFCLFRRAMRKNADIILPNFGLVCCDS